VERQGRGRPQMNPRVLDAADRVQVEANEPYRAHQIRDRSEGRRESAARTKLPGETPSAGSELGQFP
jgi:hypothetical protein